MPTCPECIRVYVGTNLDRVVFLSKRWKKKNRISFTVTATDSRTNKIQIGAVAHRYASGTMIMISCLIPVRARTLMTVESVLWQCANKPTRHVTVIFYTWDRQNMIHLFVILSVPTAAACNIISHHNTITLIDRSKARARHTLKVLSASMYTNDLRFPLVLVVDKII